jgi:RNA polymerase sigma-70 factor (ECF subfamily)
MRALPRLTEFRWESSLRSWLMGFALNCSREVLRRSRPGERSLNAMPMVVPDGASPAAVEWIDLERAIRKLDEDFRIALVLHDLEGYTHSEIAQRLGIEPGTSKSRVSRARQRLRELLDAHSQVGSSQDGGDVR